MTPTRVMMQACGSRGCGGIAWEFRSEIGFGRGRTFNSKRGCKSGRAGMERMRFTCSLQTMTTEKCRMQERSKGDGVSVVEHSRRFSHGREGGFFLDGRCAQRGGGFRWYGGLRQPGCLPIDSRRDYAF